MLFWYRRILTGVAALLVVGVTVNEFYQAEAEARKALLVGNSDYSSFAFLKNPTKDVDALEEKLTQLGFDVTKVTDVDKEEFEDSIRGFSASLRASGPNTTALFFFAGHGVSFQNQSYLMPVDSSFYDRADIPLTTLQSDFVFEQIKLAGPEVVLVFLDACRNDPFSQLPSESRGFVSRGLSEPSAVFANSGQGFFFAYATSPGAVADDGEGGNSPFTEALVDNLSDPGVSIVDMMSNVRRQVLARTNGRQRPWDSSSLLKPFYMNQNGRPTENSAAIRDIELEKDAFMQIESSRDPADFVQFLRLFPDGTFAELADRKRLELINTLPVAKSQYASTSGIDGRDFPITFKRQGTDLLVANVKSQTPFIGYIFANDVIRSVDSNPAREILNPEQYVLDILNSSGKVVFQIKRGNALIQVTVRR